MATTTKTKKNTTASQNKATNNASKLKAKPNAAKDLRDLFEDELRDILGAEKALLKALPKMAKNASSQQLSKAFADHLLETEQQIANLQEVFKVLGKRAQAKKCIAMEGLIKEGEEIMKSAKEGDVRDAGIISAAQKVEHYEIASYGTLCSFARNLGESEAEKILQNILDQEYNADKKLTEVYLTINPQASYKHTTRNKAEKTSSSSAGTAAKKTTTSAKKSGISNTKKTSTSNRKKTT